MTKPLFRPLLGAMPWIARATLLTFATAGVTGCIPVDLPEAPDSEASGAVDPPLADSDETAPTTGDAPPVPEDPEDPEDDSSTGATVSGGTLGGASGGASGGEGSSGGEVASTGGPEGTSGLPDPASSTGAEWPQGESSGESSGGSSGGSSGEVEAKTPVCGDAEVDPGEACDDGVLDGHYGGCRQDCTLAPHCGDGTVSDAETCDDGNAIGGDACPANCVAPICGDGVVQGDEQCDGAPITGVLACAALGFDAGMVGCSAHCTFDTSACVGCGDGVVQGDEQCDGELGDVTCISLGFAAGTLVCSGCLLDTSHCTQV